MEGESPIKLDLRVSSSSNSEINAYSKLCSENIFRLVFSKCFMENQISERPSLLDFVSTKEFVKMAKSHLQDVKGAKNGVEKLIKMIEDHQNQEEFIQKDALKKVLYEVSREILTKNLEMKSVKFSQIIEYCC